MIGESRVVALVPARGGSKGVPLKNLKPLGGRPLLAWTIETALATPEIDRVIVSTDHPGIAETARRCGAEVAERPAHLATDTALMADVLRHHIRELRDAGEAARYLVLLQPTSPFRLPQDISRCVGRLAGEALDSIATFVKAALHPHRAWRVTPDGPSVFIPGAVPWLPRQEQAPAYQLNGAVYAFVMDGLPAGEPGVLFGRAGAVLMDERRSLDINDELDFMVAEALIRSGLPGTDP